MADPAPRVLFVPVSGPHGMGEYARALAIARAAAARWPALQVHFALSRAAPYAAGCPFQATFFERSPTFHPRELAALIRELRPHAVVFDNAGRTAQLRAAREAGARVVYVSSRFPQRRKGFRLRWMRHLDEHWMAWPEFITGGPGPVERLKLRLLGRPRLRYLDTLLPPRVDGAEVLARFGVEPGRFVLVVPGGGTAHRGARSAPEIAVEGARRIALRGHATLLVGVADGVAGGEAPGLRRSPRIPMEELCELIRAARLVVSNGGDTLLQAIALGRPCVAVPIANDQPFRIAACVREGLAVAAALEPGSIEREAAALLDDDGRRAALEARIARHALSNGLETALDAIGGLLGMGAAAPVR
ncbi:MAG TPA: hypothetical protein VLT61_05375 [Anaeromyxobacteraceae bacterium]|nr:hypothetical protein [Anaeromyxobacteraceae bacterium]